MKFFLVAAALALPCTMALPSDTSSHSNTLVARAKPKLNQYRTLEDCQNDRNILYHAAPSTGNCYDLDGQTGAFFFNTGGFLYSFTSTDIGCNGQGKEYIKGGECRAKGNVKSVVMK